jgi:hypothetical protein
MKSIKEKSEEYGEANLTNWGVVSTERVEGFETGANYVTDEIEKILPKEDKNLNDYGKALMWRIKNTIEQLRSNQ